MTNLSTVLAKMNANGENYPCYSTKEMMNYFREAMGLLEKVYIELVYDTEHPANRGTFNLAMLRYRLESHGVGGK